MQLSSRSHRATSPHAPIERLEHRKLLAIVNVSTAAGLVDAVNNGAAGDTINVAAGNYTLTASLQPKASMTIQGTGADQTVLVADWVPSYTNLPESQASGTDDNKAAYLFNLNGNDGIKILNMTLDGDDKLQGAVFGDNADNLELGYLRVQDTLWSGIRTYLMNGSTIHNNEFINAGGRWKTGAPTTSGGVTGGAIYATYADGIEIHNNTFFRTNTGDQRNFYGVKGYQYRNSRIHHNTIHVNFSIELPHMNDHYVEIDHNYLAGVVSIPKNGGGSLPTGTDPYTFHIHHNYFKTSYALEWARNGAIVNNNLFDFATNSDGGNLMTNFEGSVSANGWTRFHDNLIKNPGRGIYTSNGGVYNNLSFYNNHVIGNTTATPRTEGMFGLPASTDFSTITIKDNIFEFNGTARPLFKTSAGYASAVENNTLTNVSDSGNYSNPNTGAPTGPSSPLLFKLGHEEEFTVDGWNLKRNAIDDASVRGGTYASNNYGADTGLALKNDTNSSFDREVYLKFNLRGISSSATSVVLNLFGTQTSTSSVVPINAYGATNTSWQESSINWNNRPSTGSTILASQNTPGNGTGQWYQFDLTSYITAEIAAGRTQATIVLKMPNTGLTYVGFNSAENAINAPFLAVT